MKRYAYGWITAAFFLISIASHWIFGWYAFINEAREHHQSAELNAYLIEMGRDTFEKLAVRIFAVAVAGIGTCLFSVHRIAFVQGKRRSAESRSTSC